LAKDNPTFFINEIKRMYAMDIKEDAKWSPKLLFTPASRLAYEVANTEENNDALRLEWLCELGASAEEAAMVLLWQVMRSELKRFKNAIMWILPPLYTLCIQGSAKKTQSLLPNILISIR
jgi:hypothetical protein